MLNKNMIRQGNIVSSATELAIEVECEYGVSREDIKATHIESFYKKLERIETAADFSSVQGILDSNITPKKEPVCGVIVETRRHHALEIVVCNIVETCGIPVQLFHGTTNLDFILGTKIVDYVESGQVVLTSLKCEKLGAKEYNALMLSPNLWQQMIGRKKILVFQTDSFCCSDSDYTLAQFMAFDYIGGTWDRARPVGLVIDGGNGGFSLRDWSVTMDCLSRFPPQLWAGGEDGYFAFHMDLIGAKVATAKDAAKFATQHYFNYRSFGAHRVNLLKQDEKQKFFEYCPFAKQVFPSDLS